MTKTGIFENFQISFIKENEELSKSMDIMHLKFPANHTISKMFPKFVMLRQIQYIGKHSQMTMILKSCSYELLCNDLHCSTARCGQHRDGGGGPEEAVCHH